jgi:hypothetical protein
MDINSELEKLDNAPGKYYWIEITSLGAKFVHEKKPRDCPNDSVLIKVRECPE